MFNTGGTQDWTAALSTAGSGNFDFNSTSAITIKSSDDNITFSTSIIELANGGDLTIDGNDTGDISVYGIVPTSLEIVTLKSSASGGAGDITVGAGGLGTSSLPLGDTTLTGKVVTLLGNINAGGSGTTTTAAIYRGDVDINTTSLVLDGDVHITTDVATGTGTHATNNDGTINIAQADNAVTKINAADTASNTEALTILSGSGTITLKATIGVTKALDSLDINSTGSAAAAITVDQIGTYGNDDNANTTKAGVSGDTNIGNASTQSVDLNDGQFNFGGTTNITAAGDITTDPNVKIKTAGDLTITPGSANAFKVHRDLKIVGTANKTVKIAGAIAGVDATTSTETITIISGEGAGATNGTIDITGAIGEVLRQNLLL